MSKNPSLTHRKSLRLKDYDYTKPGAYFITLMTWNRNLLFGEIVHEDMRLNPNGRIAARNILSLSRHFLVKIDSWVVMPNHIHMIVALDAPDSGEARVLRPYKMEQKMGRWDRSFRITNRLPANKSIA